jgi:hypothetical protein
VTEKSNAPKLRIVQNETPRARLLETAASKVPPTIEKTGSVAQTLGRAAIFVLTALLAGLAAAGADHWYRYEYSVPSRPLSVLKTIRQALPTPPRAPLTVGPDALHVTAIAMDAVPLAVVNDKRLAEGDWLEVRTYGGVAALRVVKIEDGVVHFGYGGQSIDAKFDQTSAPTPH